MVFRNLLIALTASGLLAAVSSWLLSIDSPGESVLNVIAATSNLVFFLSGYLLVFSAIRIAIKKRRRISPRVCKGSGTSPSGRITAWEGVEPLSAICPSCKLECTIDEDYDQLWVISAHMIPATK